MSGAMVWGLEATSFRQARQLCDEAAKGDGEGGVRARAVLAWCPGTRQRYRSAIGQLAAVEVRESPDPGMAEVLALCLSEKLDEGQSASGMQGIFSAVRALEDMCIVPPLVGAIHGRIAGGGVPSQGRRIMRPRRCPATGGSGRPRRGTAPSWPLSSCPGSAFGPVAAGRPSLWSWAAVAVSTALRTPCASL